MPAFAKSLLLIFLAGTCCPGSVFAAAGGSYNFEVRPILAAKCFSCHGADPKNRKGDLRLDTFAGATENGAVVPGKPGESKLMERILSTDPEEVMPPPEKHLTVTKAETEVLSRWIGQGAPYEKHWSFTAPVAPEIAGIDGIIEDSLKKHGWQAAGPLDRAGWLRRVTLALTGLPPSLAELDRFLADTSPEANARAVDRLLASPHYGERMAAVWLDAARYADTYGRHEDMDNTMWPWREWVIRSFNQNLPYDQFLTAQMAGDLLPNATQDQILATGFHRLAVMTNEAGSDPEENRWMQVFDRVKTTSSAVLGLTLECAQCHDHKYDPFSQKEYYQLAAFFDKGDEFGLFPRYCNGTPPPALLLYQGTEAAEHQKRKQAVLDAEKRLLDVREGAKARYAGWLQRQAPPSKGGGMWASLASPHGQIRPAALMTEPEFYVDFDSVNFKEGAYRLAHSQNMIVKGIVPKQKQMKGVLGNAADFPELKATRFSLPPQLAHYRRHTAFSFSFWLQVAAPPDRGVILHRCRAGQDATHRGYELMFLDGKLTASLCHYFPGNALRIQASGAVDFKTWRHVGMTYDGSSRASGLKLYLDGAPLPTVIVRDQLTRDIDYLPEWSDVISNQVADGADRIASLTLGGRVLDTGLSGAAMDEIRGYDRELSAVEMTWLAGKPLPAGDGEWFDWYAREIDRPAREALADLAAARKAENDFNIKLPEIMVMGDSTQANRKTTILARGDFAQPQETVEPNVPAALGKLPEGSPRDRLALAKWLTAPENPLTARVQVNRIWMQFFGRGLVPTPEDYGIQGQVPNQPKLLDYLAVKFVQSGWDIKALCREIALSRAFGRSSLPADATQREADPGNDRLARGPRVRLSAEQLRDSSLASSGLLVEKLGGPSLKPYQPIGLWEDSGTQHSYEQGKGEDLHRRSLYTFWRRTCPPPVMSVFDAPTREFCLVRRETTMTPLQALAVLNDTGFLEAGRVLAEGLVQEFPAEAAYPLRVTKAFRQLTSNPPSAKQLESLTQLLREGVIAYQTDAAAAQALLANTGESPLATALPPREVAATLLMVRAIFNAEPFLVSY
jgi:Protein of unknown function (DUF1553)/Protein of unknown function (DUF1549)/Planctomycete cytochrome C/Concanavalin A-like lectin/glucanases superfamily